jgi:hypothetical protein
MLVDFYFRIKHNIKKAVKPQCNNFVVVGIAISERYKQEGMNIARKRCILPRVMLKEH